MSKLATLAVALAPEAASATLAATPAPEAVSCLSIVFETNLRPGKWSQS